MCPCISGIVESGATILKAGVLSDNMGKDFGMLRLPSPFFLALKMLVDRTGPAGRSLEDSSMRNRISLRGKS